MAHTLDKAFLKAQDPEQHAALTIGAVAVVDGTVPDRETFKRLLAERVQSVPRCTQLMRTPTFEWIDDPEFEVANHVRRLVVPRPGDDAQLSQAIAYALERPLDLSRPLWECWVIEGLKGNRWAILVKTHHDVADGNSAVHLLARLCDDAGNDVFANLPGAPQISRASAQMPGWAHTLRRAYAMAGTMVGSMWPAEHLSADRVMRRYATVRVPIADVDRVCRKFGVAVNDVALAAITEGFRRVLLSRGEEPRADSLRTLVPTAVRSPVLPYLPVEHDDPVLQLRTVHNRWKVQHKRQASFVEAAINCLPTMLRTNVLQLLARLPHTGLVTLGTHAPGPRHQLRLMGQTMERLLPIPPTAVQLSTGVAVLSYGDDLVFGITTAHDAALDVKQLAAGIELGMARLVALSDDSVLLFSDHRRRRSSRASGGAPR